MKRLIYILCCLLIVACTDEVDLKSGGQAGAVMQFRVEVDEGEPSTRGHVIDTNDNDVTLDFAPGDAFGLFIIDADDNFVSLIDGKNARNIKLTTPDGKAWNLDSDIKEIVHRLGYRYVAYFPYSEAFNDCESTDDILALLTPPDADQTAQPAIDWMYADVTAPQANAVTVLRFAHRYAKIDIYNSFTQEHVNSWLSAYPYTRTIDENGVEHYRYIVDATSPTILPVDGTYSIGNSLTGIKQFAYQCGDITIQNGRHAIVYTYRMDERCAVDLGLPSGVKWSPINLGAETSTYMDVAAIAAVANVPGKRLAWGELFEKDVYSYDTYINDPYNNGEGKSLLPADLAETVYDPARQYWGGHWSLPNAADVQEFIDNTEVVNTETVYCEALGKDVSKITFRSKINGNELTLLTNGYVNSTSLAYPNYLYYMSSTRSGIAYCSVFTSNSTIRVISANRYTGIGVRPVLKETYTYTDADKKAIILRHINDIAVDLGITKTVTETIDGVSQQVTYKLLWSPFNYGVETRVPLQLYNRQPVDEAAFVDKCYNVAGMRLAWGDIVERSKFSTTDYESSAIVAKYDYFNTSSTPIDTRDLLPEDDIVQVNWANGWSIPTAGDFQLLIDNTTVTKETINGETWFRLTANNGSGNSILIPATSFIDDTDNYDKRGAEVYLQSSTVGLKGSSSKHTVYALRIANTTASLASTAGRPTGLTVRPVRYVRYVRTD